MKIIEKLFCFVKEHVWQTILAFFGGLVVIFGLTVLVRGKQLQWMRNEGKIAEVKHRVNDLYLRREYFQKMNLLDLEQLKRLERDKINLKREIEIARDTAGMTDEEALDAFEKLGY